jgi:transposase
MKTIIGIDWSEKKHCVHLYNKVGAELANFEVSHTLSGFERLERRLAAVNPVPADNLIAIETSYNLLVDFLYSRGYTIYILAPAFVKSNRGRQGSSGQRMMTAMHNYWPTSYVRTKADLFPGIQTVRWSARCVAC